MLNYLDRYWFTLFALGSNAVVWITMTGMALWAHHQKAAVMSGILLALTIAGLVNIFSAHQRPE